MADNNLFPAGYENETSTPDDTAESTSVGYKPGLRFDYEGGDFVQDGRFRIQNADGVESWKGWCKACLMTERYQHLAYNTDFGIETAEAFAAETHDQTEALLARQISEALSADPYGRTDYVEDIIFDWTAPDTVLATVIVHGIEGVTIEVKAEISG